MFAGLFGKPRFLNADLEEWSFDTWAWLMRHRGGMARIAKSQWVLPTRDFFPPTDATGHARAEHMFRCVKTHMGMAEWPCRLASFDRVPQDQRVAEVGSVRVATQANGLFWLDEDGRANIEYAADLIDQPLVLAGTLAHELSHYLLSHVPVPPPGGEEAEELATELAVAYAGLGLFTANTSMAFSGYSDTYSQGWRVSGQGYLSERTWALALATFGALKGERAPETHMRPTLAKAVKAAEKHLAKHPEPLEALRGIA